jgi:hypothetical protein
MGPRKVITMPVTRKSRKTKVVPLVETGSLSLVLGLGFGLGLELMIYDECKSAGLGGTPGESNA